MLGLSFYARPTEQVARDLIGKVLVRRLGKDLRRARIVEVEAYLGERDAASHARFGRTSRSAIMFGPAGRLYVYLIYGVHHCMNCVAHAEGESGAILLRAAEPLGPTAKEHDRPLRGPGKLCRELGITRAHNDSALTGRDAPLFLEDDGYHAARIDVSARIGIDYAGAWARRKLRFTERGNRHVSGK